jgi:hypothetical protein
VSRSIAKTDDRDRADNRRTREWRETFETLEAGERIRAALLDEFADMTPSFPRSGVSGHAGAVHTANHPNRERGCAPLVNGFVNETRHNCPYGVGRGVMAWTSD